MELNQEYMKELYPYAMESKATLPSCWNSKDKHVFIKLSQGNCRVQYKGPGKSHKDAAAVRANGSIPLSCGLYYFEVRIVSKGQDGYIGVGLSEGGVCLNRLPGWEKRSYGYHGDDGNSFSSSGSGVSYGPMFTTGDVIGCGVNMEDRTCFYTKNGQNLGITFKDLPSNLFPMVGLQTPGEVLEANFGQSPFVYDIKRDIEEHRCRALMRLRSVPLPDSRVESFRSLIASYLVHQGYPKSATEFAAANGVHFEEPLELIVDRRTIRKYIIRGQISRAMSLIHRHYPLLLSDDLQLRLLLMCSLFVEMFAPNSFERASLADSDSAESLFSQSDGSDVETTLSSSKHCRFSSHSSNEDSPISSAAQMRSPGSDMAGSPPCSRDTDSSTTAENSPSRNGCEVETYGNGVDKSQTTVAEEAEAQADGEEAPNGSTSPYPMEMENGLLAVAANDFTIEEFEKLITLGRAVSQVGKQLEAQNLFASELKRLMRDAFGLIAYERPEQSPFAYLLDQKRRVALSVIVNSAILRCTGHPRVSKLELLFKYARHLRRLLKDASVGASVFIDPQDFLTGDYLKSSVTTCMHALQNMDESIFSGVGKKILAPMVRVTTLPFRELALDYGADLVYTEETIDHKVLSCCRRVNDHLKTVDYAPSEGGEPLFMISEREKPRLVFQLGTSNADRAVQAALIVQQDVAAIDVNMGCPKPFSISGGMGVALLQQPEKVKEILTALVTRSGKPVCCKIRILPKLEDTLELCRIIERCGVQAIAVHGRTASERSSSDNHDAHIAAICGAVDIPVIANGGSNRISHYGDIETFRQNTGARHVMIGRAAMANPSIFSPKRLEPFESVVLKYLEYAVKYDQCVKLVKYTLQRMEKERRHLVDFEHPASRARSLREVCKIFGMEERHDEIVRSNVEKAERRHVALAKNTFAFKMPFLKRYFNSNSPKQMLINWCHRQPDFKPSFFTQRRKMDGKFKGTVSLRGYTFTSEFWAPNRRQAEQAASLVAMLCLGLHDMLPKDFLEQVPAGTIPSCKLACLRSGCLCPLCKDP